MKTISGVVEVKIKDAQGKEIIEQSPVTFPFFESAEDILSVLGDNSGDVVEFQLADGKTVVKLAPKTAELLVCENYGANLKARATVRAALLNKLEGPEKAINRQVEQLVKARAAKGKPITEVQARKIVLLTMEMEVDAEPATA